MGRGAAGFDDEPDHGLRDPATRAAWRELLVGVLPADPCDVIDLGCGTGSLSVLLAETGHRVRGLDISPGMLALARAKADAARVSVDFQMGDAARPSYQAGSGDVVLARHVLWAMPDPTDAIHRWVALLRPEGRLVLVEGRWSTGAGINAVACEALLAEHGRSATVRPLVDPVLWGAPVRDERYLVVS